MKYAHKKAIELASKNRATISLDQNLRLPLWKSSKDFRYVILEFLPLANMLKNSDAELEFITEINYENEALKILFKGNVKVVIHTKGAIAAMYTLEEIK